MPDRDVVDRQQHGLADLTSPAFGLFVLTGMPEKVARRKRRGADVAR